jgi:hypothetical protein
MRRAWFFSGDNRPTETNVVVPSSASSGSTHSGTSPVSGSIVEIRGSFFALSRMCVASTVLSAEVNFDGSA